MKLFMWVEVALLELSAMFKSALMVSSNRFMPVNMQQEGSVKDLPQPAVQHHPQYWDVKEFPSLSAVFQIICFHCVRMLSIHQHLYTVSCNSHLLFFLMNICSLEHFLGSLLACRVNPHPSSLQHNPRWGIKLGNRSRIYYVTPCGLRRGLCEWEYCKEVSTATWIKLFWLMRWKIPEISMASWVTWKAKHNISHQCTEAPQGCYPKCPRIPRALERTEKQKGWRQSWDWLWCF